VTLEPVNLAYGIGELKPEAHIALTWDEVEHRLPGANLAPAAVRLGFANAAGLRMATTPVLVTVGDKQVLLLYVVGQHRWFALMDEEAG